MVVRREPFAWSRVGASFLDLVLLTACSGANAVVADGIHDGIPEGDYHADEIGDEPSLSATLATILLQTSPAHAYANHPKLNADYQTSFDQKYDLGTAVHALLLEGRDVVGVVDANDWRTNDAKALRDHHRANGKVPLLAKDWESAQAIWRAANAQLFKVDADPPLLTGGLSEQTLVWHEPNGVLCRARADYLQDGAVDDLKTTSRSANPVTFTRTVFDLGYHIKAEFYRRGVERLTGRRPAFRFIVVETAAPYALSVLSLAPSAEALAVAQVDHAIEVWAQCLESGEWPGYGSRIAYAETPAWVEAQWLEREAREAVNA